MRTRRGGGGEVGQVWVVILETLPWLRERLSNVVVLLEKLGNEVWGV